MLIWDGTWLKCCQNRLVVVIVPFNPTAGTLLNISLNGQLQRSLERHQARTLCVGGCASAPHLFTLTRVYHATELWIIAGMQALAQRVNRSFRPSVLP
ncbi:hypothetical protein [Pseudomonas phage PIP]|nr:hypothetical protein [Pseudomonas phage PIP]